MIVELNVLIYTDREGLLSGRILREDGCSSWPIDPDNQGFMGEVVADEVNEAIERLGLRRPRAWSTREGAYSWCTCLGWIATLQETAELAYLCGVSDAPIVGASEIIGAEQVRVAAQNAGLVPEDPDPFDFLEGSA